MQTVEANDFFGEIQGLLAGKIDELFPASAEEEVFQFEDSANETRYQMFLRLNHDNKKHFADALRSATGYVVSDQILGDFIEALGAKIPLLIEGPRGGGKTAFAKALADYLQVPLFRVQCMEGLKTEDLLYRWDHEGQNHFVSQALAAGKTLEEARAGIHTTEFLIFGTVLQAYLESESRGIPVVVLLDEIDKLDPASEDKLLQVLEEKGVSIPKLPGGPLGSVNVHPIVFLTSNGMRHDVSSPLRSRCCYTYLKVPTMSEEVEILNARVPSAPERLLHQTVQLLQELRHSTFIQDKPGIREAIPFLESVVRQGGRKLTASVMNQSLTHLVKREDDLFNLRLKLAYFEDLLTTLVPGPNRLTQQIPVCRLTQRNEQFTSLEHTSSLLN